MASHRIELGAVDHPAESHVGEPPFVVDVLANLHWELGMTVLVIPSGLSSKIVGTKWDHS